MSTPDTVALLVWYTVSSGGADEPLPIGREELKQRMVDAGIDVRFAPASSRAVDAFRLATTGATDTYEIDGVTYRLFTRDARATDGYLMRRVYRSWVDADGDAKEERTADLQFFRPRRTMEGKVVGSERIRTLVDKRLRGRHRARAQAMVEKIKAAYKVHQEQVNAQGVRAMMRAYLARIGAVSAADSSGGTWLVSPDKEDLILRLQGVLAACGPGCRLRLVPLTASPLVTELVAASARQELQDRASGILRQMHDWVSKHPRRPPTQAKARVWRDDCAILQELVIEYSERFGTTFPETSILIEEIVALLDELR